MGMRELLVRALTLPKADPDSDTYRSLPELQNSHGGSFVSGAVRAAQSGFTYPRDVYMGTQGDPMTDDASFERLMDLSGLASVGGLPVAPDDALTVGAKMPKAKGPPPVGKWSKFAEQYPPVPPPVEKFDPKGNKGAGKHFLAKGSTPENKQFMKDRLAIQHDMKANGYEPFFDPAQRYDVDPGNYPAPHETLTQNRAKTAKVQQQYDAETMDPAVLERLDRAYQAGQGMDMENWYAMGQLENEFIKEFGEEAGRRLFKERFAGSMAATTGGADPQNNLLMAHYGNYLQQKGQSRAVRSYEMPNPIGGRYASGNMKIHDEIGDAGFDIPGSTSPKRYNFQQNYLGHTDRATIDEQMMGLIDPQGKYGEAPPNDMYGHFEQPVHVLAEKYGVSPRTFQEVAWGGGKRLKDPSFEGGPMIQTVNDAIERTHRLTGMPREEIVRRGLLRAEIPLFARNNVMAAMIAGNHHVPGKPDTVKIPGHGEVPAAPVPAIQSAADSYMAAQGRPGAHRINEYPEFDEDNARRIAEAFDVMQHNPQDPATRRSYDAMIEETLGQYRSLKDAGIDIQFLKDGESDPYAASPALGYMDLQQNGRLKVFPTDQGFGTLNAVDDNPLLKRVGKVGDLDNATANDAFRAVHDLYGHFGPGNPFFRHKGEERAWINHSQMYSDDARPAMTTETRGQNSWLNFGPYGEQNRNALGADTVFADQKIGLLPDWAQQIVKKYGIAGISMLPVAMQMQLMPDTAEEF